MNCPYPCRNKTEYGYCKTTVCINPKFDRTRTFTWYDPIEIAPIIEAEPRKHGRWIDRGKDMCIRWKCSECGRKDTHIYNYCPDCGARMDEVADE